MTEDRLRVIEELANAALKAGGPVEPVSDNERLVTFAREMVLQPYRDSLVLVTEVRRLRAENERLRGLIETANQGADADDCGWCGRPNIAINKHAGRPCHATDCPAFTVDGVVK